MNKVRVVAGELRLVDVATRFPVRYGIATVTKCPCAFVKLTVEVDGCSEVGISSDFLAPRWFTKNVDESPDDETRTMLRVIEKSLALAVGLAGSNPFELWWQLYHAVHDWGRSERLAPLLVSFGATFIERCVIEAACRAWKMSFGEALSSGRLGLALGRLHHELDGIEVRELLPKQPRASMTVRQTVGIGMPLTEEDVGVGERLNDGLPESLESAVRRYGLRQFKVKLSGHSDTDGKFLERFATFVRKSQITDYAVTLDGNECFHSVQQFHEFWEALSARPALADVFRRTAFIEQPLARQIALDGDVDWSRWSNRPPVIIDESDAELQSLRRALSCGYAGTSHKNCKGVFKSVCNTCYLTYLKGLRPDGGFLMTGEDMGNIGPVALLQDLAVAAAIGLDGVERNGHHYFAGLSMFSSDVRRQMLDAHSDLYGSEWTDWPTVRIEHGQMNLNSVNAAPLGVGFRLRVEQFMSPHVYRRACGL